MRPLRPTSLTDAYWQAREMEEVQPTKKSYLPQFQKFSSSNSYKPPQSNVQSVPKPLESAANGQRQRQKGVCWRCGDSWIPGHKCKQIPILNYIADTARDDGQQPPNTEAEEIEDNNEITENPADQCMKISTQALGNMTCSNIPTVIVTVGNKRAVALIDSGSNTSFMDMNFAIKANCSLTPAEARDITVAGGGKLTSTAMIPQCEFSIAQQKFSAPFRVLHLPDHEVILGCD